jgi:hypothetical protein
MFPYRDETSQFHTPLGTISIIVLNALAWVLIQGLGAERHRLARLQLR